jgi:hypothetical protein
MSDFDSEKMTPDGAKASVAFVRALTGVDTRCKHIATLLDMNDLGEVALVARSAADRLLTGRAAYRWIVESEPAKNPAADEASRRLEAAHVLLLDLISRVRALTLEHETKIELDKIWLELVTAAAQPNNDVVTSAEPSRASEAQEMAIDD